MSNDVVVDKLIEMLDKKSLLLKDMLVFSREQAHAIDAEDVEQLNKLVDKKQKRIDKINIIDKEFQSLFNELKEQLGIKSMEQINSALIPKAHGLKDSVNYIIRLVEEISLVERENQDKAKRLMNALSDNIKNVSNAKKLNNVYRPSLVQTPSYFMDKKK